MKFTKIEDYVTLGDEFSDAITQKIHLEKGDCTQIFADGSKKHYRDGIEHDPQSGLFIIRSQEEFDSLKPEQKQDREFLLIPD